MLPPHSESGRDEVHVLVQSVSDFRVKVGRQQYAPCRASDSSWSCSVASGFPVEVYVSHAHAGVRADAALSVVSCG